MRTRVSEFIFIQHVNFWCSNVAEATTGGLCEFKADFFGRGGGGGGVSQVYPPTQLSAAEHGVRTRTFYSRLLFSARDEASSREGGGEEGGKAEIEVCE